MSLKPTPVTSADLAELQHQIADLTAAVAMLTTQIMQQGDASVKLLKPEEVGKLFRCSKSTVYALMAANAIPAIPLMSEDGTKRVPLIGLRAAILEKLQEVPGVNLELLSKLLSNDNGADEAAP